MNQTLKKNLCKYCKNILNEGAKVCSVCNRHQKHLAEYFLPTISTSISIVMVLLSVIQLIYASNERSKADDALKEALLAKEKILKTEREIDSMSVTIDSSKKEINRMYKDIVELAKIFPRTGGFGGGILSEDSSTVEHIIKKAKRQTK